MIDLDPGEPAGLGECAQVALLVRDRLAADGLDCVPVTSGSKGIHLYADAATGQPALRRGPRLRQGDRRGAREGAPEAGLSQMTKARRSGKVFLDWSQNTGSKTTISPYSLRGRELPTVAAPRTWEEIEAGAEDPLAIEQLRFEEVLERIERQGDLLDLDSSAREARSAAPGTRRMRACRVSPLTGAGHAGSRPLTRCDDGADGT